MSDDSSSLLEEELSLFRPFTRESLLAIEARIADELEKQKELEKRRAEGEVREMMMI
jgi:voltage-gated sodium channel type II alpha